MRPLTADEIVRLDRHLALTRTVRRYALHRQRALSSIRLLTAVARTLEALPARSAHDDEVRGRIHGRLATQVPQVLPAAHAAEDFRTLRDHNLRALLETLGR